MKRQRHGFTLVELLVVIGIITLLITLLLPALINSRKAAALTKCLSQMREIGQALSQYRNEFHGWMPDSCSSDSTDSPMSAYYAGRTTGPAPELKMEPMTPIDRALAKYMGFGYRLWQCPSQPRARHPMNPLEDFRAGDFRLPGMFGEQVLVPGYMYVAGKEYYPLLTVNPKNPIALQFHMYEWATRNLAGFSTGALNQPGSEVVVFTDYSALFHSGAPRDVYNLRPGETYPYKSNFLFVDGHAETVQFKDIDSMFQHVHKAIKQKIFDLDMAATFPEYYQ